MEILVGDTAMSVCFAIASQLRKPNLSVNQYYSKLYLFKNRLETGSQKSEKALVLETGMPYRRKGCLISGLFVHS